MNIYRKEYALYKGEILIAIGKVNELAEKLNVKPSTLRHYTKPCYINTITENSKKRLMLLIE